jgi:hypothetical protein
MSVSDELFLRKGFQECLKMPELTRRKVGRSDNNNAAETPYLDANMARRMVSMFEQRRHTKESPYPP